MNNNSFEHQEYVEQQKYKTELNDLIQIINSWRQLLQLQINSSSSSIEKKSKKKKVISLEENLIILQDSETELFNKKVGDDFNIIEFLEQKLSTISNEDDYYNIQETITFIYEERNKSIGSTLTWINRLLTTYKKQEIEENNQNLEVDGLSDSQQAEKIKNELLSDEIIDIGIGMVTMSFSLNISPNNQAGFQTMLDNEFSEPDNIDPELKDKMNKQGAAEGILIKELKEDEIDTRVIQASQEGIFRFLKREPKYESYIKGQRDKLFSEYALSSDKNEKAYLLTYLVNPNSSTIEESFLDYTNRPGQILLLKIVIPQSLLQRINTENIQLIRKLAKKFLEKSFNNNKIDNFENTWEIGEGNSGKPLKPPYEIFDKKGLEPVVLKR